ncbi:MAG TPA: tetratricopeptide repeat protein [Caulobacterales bacterium]|nr:tetratricopeptide repeat protein [Caulobacterales bacterium]
MRARHYTLRGDAYVRQGDLQAALRDFDEAIRLNRSLESLRHRQSVRLKLKMYKEAFADADAAQLLDKGSPSSLNASCWVRAVAGLELKAGLSACDRALKMRPNNPAFLDSRGLMRLRLGDYEGARTDYTAALRWWPELASSRYGLGVALMRLGRTAEGQQEIAAAVKMSESIAADFESFGIKP